MTERTPDPFGREEERPADPFGTEPAAWLPPRPEQGPAPQPADPEPSWEPPVVAAGSAPVPGKATAAMILGILGIVVCPLVCSVPAIIFGVRGRREIDASGGHLGGRAQAVAGIVLGWVGVAFAVAFVLLVVLGLVAGDGSSGGSTETLGRFN